MAWRATGALSAAIAMVAVGGSLALAGGPIDPDGGDDFVGKAGKLRYAQDAQLAATGSALLAGCGKEGHRLIGGGGTISGPADQSFLTIARPWDFIDADDDADDGWWADGNGPPGTAASVTAICRKPVNVKYLTAAIAAGSQSRAGEIDCGGKRWHVTTGSAFPSASGSWTHSSYPIDDTDRGSTPDDGWAVRLFSGSSVSASTMYAICVKKLKLRYKHGPATTLGTSSVSERTGTREVSCGKRANVVGGGASVSGLINRGRLLATVPTDSGDKGEVPDDRWRATAYNLGGTATTMESFAICLKKKKRQKR